MIRGNYATGQFEASSSTGWINTGWVNSGWVNSVGVGTVTDVADKLARKNDRGHTGEPGRQMRLALAHIGVWSSAKFAFLLSVCLNTVTVVLILLTARVLTDTEVFAGVTGVYQDLTNQSVDLGVLLNAEAVWAFAAAVVVLNTVLITAIGTGYAVLYNLSVRATGGVLLGFGSD